MPEIQKCNGPSVAVTFAKMPWGCRMSISPETKWPLRAEIIHAPTNGATGEGCKCRESLFTDKELVIKYMHMTAYFVYHLKDPETYNAWKVNELVKQEAKRLGLGAGNIWEQYPSCIPRTQDLDLNTCPAGVPVRDVTQMEDGTVVVFEGKTLGPGGRSLTELLAEEETFSRRAT